MTLTPSKAIPISPLRTIRGSPFKGSSPSKSLTKRLSTNIWDPDDDEFPDWPGTYKATYGTFKTRETPQKETLKSLHCDTVVASTAPNSDDDPDPGETGPTREELALREEEERRNTIDELNDPACGNPNGSDMHDEMLVRYKLFRNGHAELPADLPARYMHLLRWQVYAASRRDDEMIQPVCPRLCDAIATVLFETSSECLDRFLDARVRVFEWRHNFSHSGHQLCAIIRRDGNVVFCGVYRNLGFQYLWNCLVKSYIHFSGRWSEVFAHSRGTTAVSDGEPLWDEFVQLTSDADALPDPNHPFYALFVGRQLACYLVDADGKLWEVADEWGETLEWEVDGVVTSAKVRGRGGYGSGREEDADEED